MKKVVLFKSVSEDYKKAFSDKNFETVFVEPLQFDLLNLSKLSEKLDDGEYDGVIFTSPRAIEATSKCWNPSRFVLWSKKKVYTVGEGSTKKIQALLGLESLGAATGNAENLAKQIINENPKSSRFLFPCGNLKSETVVASLQENSINVDALTVYLTKENDNLKTNLIELNEHKPTLCGLIFFSPSGCEYIYRQLQTFSNNLSVLPHFAIGNSTAHKIVNLGAEVAGVAALPKPECIVESVQNYFTELQA